MALMTNAIRLRLKLLHVESSALEVVLMLVHGSITEV